MRNLKKFLALVLAMMMVFSLMITVNAASWTDWTSSPDGTGFADDGSIPASYDEAVQVLSELGVFQGTDDGSEFEPNRTFTRAQVAAVVYRIATGDVTNKLVGQDGGYSSYKDLDENHWANAYINYDTIAGYMVGTDDGNFAPDRPVNGYEVLATILRVIGYDKNGEFTGATWQQKTSSTARTLNITSGISATQLQQPATRALVAELLFRTITKTTTVKYNAQFLEYETKYYTLAWDVFSLYGGGSNATPGAPNVPAGSPYDATQSAIMMNRADATADSFYGAPVAYWYQGRDNTTGRPATIIPVSFDATKTYTTAVTVQQVYADLGLSAASVPYNYQVDGTNGGITPGNLVKNNVNNQPIWVGDGTTGNLSSIKNFTDYGVLTEVYVADNQIFITSVNTYIDEVSRGYVDRNTRLYLTASATDASIDYVLAPNEDAVKAAVGDFEQGDVVIYHQYMFNSTSATDLLGLGNGNVYIDYATIHEPDVLDVTVVDTVDQPEVTPTSQDSNFRSTSKTYRYNPKYNLPLKPDASKSFLNDKDQGYVNRNSVYVDDYGYALHIEPYAAAAVQGYALVMKGGQPQEAQGSLNGVYVPYTVKLEDGSEVILNGAIQPNENASLYTNENEAKYTAKGMDIGLYYYVKLANDYYRLIRIDASATNLDASPNDTDLRMRNTYDNMGDITGSEIKRDDPDALATPSMISASSGVVPSDALLSDDTLFFVAEYNSDGTIKAFAKYQGLAEFPGVNARAANTVQDKANDITTGKIHVEYVYNTAKHEITMVVIRNANVKTGTGKAETRDTFILTNKKTVQHLYGSEYYNWYEDAIVSGSDKVMFARGDDMASKFTYHASSGDTVGKSATDASLSEMTPYEYKVEDGYITDVWVIAPEASGGYVYTVPGVLSATNGNVPQIVVAKNATIKEILGTQLVDRELKYLTSANAGTSGTAGWTVYVINKDATGRASLIYVKK